MKLGFLDIETAPIVAAVWGLHDQNIPYQHILQDWYIICASWKWEGANKVCHVSLLDDPARFKKDHSDDYHVVRTLHGVLNEADVIVAHNGDAFDIKKIMARVAFHKFSPISYPVTIDTLKEARRQYKFTSNRLDHLGAHLGVRRKKETSPGLWIRALDGQEKAIKEMVSYNKRDVTLLEDVYHLLRPHMKKHPNRRAFYKGVCSKCGENDLHLHRQRLISSGALTVQFKCGSCGSYETPKKKEM